MKSTKNVLIIGATSGIGRAVAEAYIKRGCKVAVTGRRLNLLQEIKALNSAKVFIYENDVTLCKAEELLPQIAEHMGGIDTILICAGIGDINLTLTNRNELDTVKTNVLGFTDWADSAYKYLAKRAEGARRLAAISSIASFRGSDAAPAYYASKAYVSNYLEGLRKKAFKENIDLSITTIIPGFVDTALAKGVGGTDGLFWVAPTDKAAEQIVSALDKRKDSAYITARWLLIAWVLKVTPFWLYKRFY